MVQDGRHYQNIPEMEPFRRDTILQFEELQMADKKTRPTYRPATGTKRKR